MTAKRKKLIFMICIIVFIIAVALIIVFSIGNKKSTAQTKANIKSGTKTTSSNLSDLFKNSKKNVTESTANNQKKFVNSLISLKSSTMNEEEKFQKIDFDKSPLRPIYNPVITLDADNGLDSSKKTSAPWTSIISPDGAQTKTFGLTIQKDVSSQAVKIVWQVSRVPFTGISVSSSSKPGGLLLSGETTVSAKSFSVDFSKVYAADNSTSLSSKISSSNKVIIGQKSKLMPTSGKSALDSLGAKKIIPLRTYYIRAFPVSKNGSSIGDSGVGLPILYGDAQPVQKSNSVLIPSKKIEFSLKPAKFPSKVTYNGEYPNNFVNSTEVVLSNTDSKMYAILPSGFPSDTQKLLVQVSLTKYSSSSDWNDAPGLVCQMSLSPEDDLFKGLSNAKSNGISIDFSKFVPSDSELPEKDYISYYIRAVALTAGKQPGTANSSFSKTVTVKYGKYQGDTTFYPEVKVKPNIPDVQNIAYTPAHWETPGWQYHYVVNRQPTEKEVFGSWGSNKPFDLLKVGTKLDFTPQPENKSWWEEAWDAVSDFLSDITSFVAKIVNWVSSSYASLKSGLINIVVSALPSSLQGSLRTALTAVVDYGLASIGIPPTLPNFDDLASMGTDYLATVAMEQAGVSPELLSDYGVDELSGQMKSAIGNSSRSASPNPMGWDFIKLDSDYLYCPAYITLDLYNPNSDPTPAGKLSFTVSKSMDMSKNGSDSTITYLYGKYGSSYVYLFKPVFGMEIPSIAPGKHLSVPVILDGYVGQPFPGCSAPVNSDSFKMMYKGLGTFDFNLSIQYNLQAAADEAKKQGKTQPAIYSYSTTGNYLNFSANPNQAYAK